MTWPANLDIFNQGICLHHMCSLWLYMDACWWLKEGIEMLVCKISMSLKKLKFDKWCQCYKTIIGWWLAYFHWVMDLLRKLLSTQKACLVLSNLLHPLITWWTHAHEPVVKGCPIETGHKFWPCLIVSFHLVSWSSFNKNVQWRVNQNNHLVKWKGSLLRKVPLKTPSIKCF